MAKNKLQKDFLEYLRSLQGTIVDADRIKDLKVSILNKADELNKVHHRCHPLKISISKKFDNTGFRVSNFQCLDFYILEGYHINDIKNE